MTTHLDLIGFVTSDMAAAITFYRHLGLDFPAGAESEQHVEYTLPTGMRIAFDTVAVVQSFDTQWTVPTGGHRIAPAFRCDSPSEVDALYAQLVTVGGAAHVEPWDAVWGQRYAVVLDPDGNSVDLFATL